MVQNLQGFDFFKSDQKINMKIDNEKTVRELGEILNEGHKSVKAINEAVAAREFKDVKIEGNKMVLEKS